MSGFNMPPGVSVSDIPGNEPVKRVARQMGFSSEASALLGAFAKATKRRKRAVASLKTAISVAAKSAGHN